MEKEKQEWLDQALEIVDSEEELNGPMPQEVMAALTENPTKSLRALVRATKKSIKERLIKHFQDKKACNL